ncbi:MAG TPA: shikimate dehydrogenase [Solirubrobacteraceae bacterium]|nr:shikimate dehydrogenase [Solirubrobacteraceae bacterium]
MRRFGVLGWPVKHSRSPAMHNAAYAALGLRDHRYQHLPVPPELLAETVRALPRAGFAGANVTIPHKEAALAVADEATERARAIGAANTLTFSDDGTIHADNTDAPGLLAALGDDVPRTALVLGAGGSARAAIWALRQAGAEVSVLARTPARAEGLQARIVDTPEPAECLVNCTPIGLDDPDALPADPRGYATVVDLVYRDGGTRLVREAQSAGARTVDGLEILVRQGALSLEIWTGLEPPLDAMRLAARGVH